MWERKLLKCRPLLRRFGVGSRSLCSHRAPWRSGCTVRSGNWCGSDDLLPPRFCCVSRREWPHCSEPVSSSEKQSHQRVTGDTHTCTHVHMHMYTRGLSTGSWFTEGMPTAPCTLSSTTNNRSLSPSWVTPERLDLSPWGRAELPASAGWEEGNEQLVLKGPLAGTPPTAVYTSQGVASFLATKSLLPLFDKCRRRLCAQISQRFNRMKGPSQRLWGPATTIKLSLLPTLPSGSSSWRPCWCRPGGRTVLSSPQYFSPPTLLPPLTLLSPTHSTPAAHTTPPAPTALPAHSTLPMDLHFHEGQCGQPVQLQNRMFKGMGSQVT